MGTKGHPGIYLLAAVFAAACFSASAAPPDKPAQSTALSCSFSASDISKEIQQKGIDELIHRLTRGHDGQLYDYTGLNQLVGCIWGGKKEWLDIAVPMVAKLQPDNEDDLSDAVQNALLVNPEVVLSEPWPDYFTLRDYICTVSVDDYSPPNADNLTEYRLAMAELEKRVRVVKQIKRSDLKAKVDECLAGFKQTKKNFAGYYQIDKPSHAPDPGTAPPAPDPGTAPLAPDPGTAPPPP